MPHREYLIPILLLSLFSVKAQPYILAQKLVASDRSVNDQFGSAVDISGNHLVVGSHLKGRTQFHEAGAAYVYQKNEYNKWTEVQLLTNSDRAPNDFFGAAVAISGDFMAISAPKEDEDELGQAFVNKAGSVYIFGKDQNNVWLEVQKIVASDRDDCDAFGSSVSLAGDDLVIGAPGNEAVYVFKRQSGSWLEVDKFTAPGPQTNTKYGHSVSIAGNRIIVGAPQYSHGPPNCPISISGVAYIYERTKSGEWQYYDKLSSSQPQMHEFFGWSVAISGLSAAVGGYMRSETDPADSNTHYGATGAVYIFERDFLGAWQMVHKALELGPYNIDYLGYSVDIDGDRVVAGASQKTLKAPSNQYYDGTGAAYVYEKQANGQWQRTQRLEADVQQSYDEFGTALALEGSFVVVAAPKEDEDENEYFTYQNSGSVYVFHAGAPISLSEEASPRLEAFPNPTEGRFNLHLAQDHPEIQVRILDVAGRLIEEARFTHTRNIPLHLSGPAGMYYVEVFSGSQTPAVFKVIKE